MGGMKIQRLRWFRILVWCLLMTFGLQVTLPALPAASSLPAPSARPSAEAVPPFSVCLMANLGAAPLAPKYVHFAPDPVNLSNGNLYLPMRDLYLPASRFPLTIDRAYNSRSTADSPFGFGWSFNYGVKIRQDATGLLVQEGDGSTRRYQSSRNGFESKIGAYSRITKSADGSGVRERFDAKGRLGRLEDGNGADAASPPGHCIGLGSTEEQALGNMALSKCTMIGTALLGAILVLASLHSPRPASAQPQGQSSAQLEAELSSKTADLNKAQADLLQIKAGITAIDSFSTLPEGRLKREAKNQAYRSYIQYVEGLDPDLAPFANVVASPEEIKKVCNGSSQGSNGKSRT